MSAIATLHTIPANRLSEFEAAASSAEFASRLAAMQTSSLDFEYSGWILATLLPVLQMDHAIDLMSANPNLTNALSQLVGGTVVIFTTDQRNHLAQLDATPFDPRALQQAFEEFNQVDGDGVGDVMMQGIQFLRLGLTQVNPDTSVILTIG